MAEGVKIAARNQKAFHEYFIDEKFEAGIELTGTEVKSIRLGTLSLKEAWCQIKDGQLDLTTYDRMSQFLTCLMC